MLQIDFASTQSAARGLLGLLLVGLFAIMPAQAENGALDRGVIEALGLDRQ